MILLAFALGPFLNQWHTDFQEAQQIAQKENRFILLSFSGSDWCGPCIRLHKEVFDSQPFEDFATVHLVLVNADFPRQKKNRLPKTLEQQNNQLADKYNPTGIFPLTVLLTADGKALKAWEGYPKQGAESLINEINLAIHDHS